MRECTYSVIKLWKTKGKISKRTPTKNSTSTWKPSQWYVLLKISNVWQVDILIPSFQSCAETTKHTTVLFVTSTKRKKDELDGKEWVVETNKKHDKIMATDDQDTLWRRSFRRTFPLLIEAPKYYIIFWPWQIYAISEYNLATSTARMICAFLFMF